MPSTIYPSAEILKIFETIPACIAVLSPDYIILTASDDYLEATKTNRDEIRCRNIFEVFPENPDTPEAHSSDKLRRSLEKVLSSKLPHQMGIQRHDVPNPLLPGTFLVRYWEPLNKPVLNGHGQVEYIIHIVRDVTDQIVALGDRTGELLKGKTLYRDLAEELAAANEELAASNDKLQAINEEVLSARESEQIAYGQLTEAAGTLQLALESAQMGTWTAEFNTNTAAISEQASIILGIPQKGKYDLHEAFNWIQSEFREEVKKSIGQSVIATGFFEERFIIKQLDGGSPKWVKTTGKAFFDSDHKPIKMIGTIVDISKSKKRESLLEYLNKAGEELALARDTQTALEKISTLIVPKFADWFTINVLKENILELLFIKNDNQEYVNWAIENRRKKPLTIDDQGIQGHVIRTGESSLIPIVTEEIIKAANLDAEQLKFLSQMTLRSSIVAPMKIHGRIIGTISFVTTAEGSQYDQEDLNFAKDLATRIALALENARLHEQAQIEKKKAEISLNNLHRMIMEAPVAMCILTGSNYVTAIANSKMFELWGIGTEFLNKPIFEGLPHLKAEFKPLLDEVFFQDKTISFNETKTELLRDGELEPVYINFIYQPVKEADGSTSGVLAVAVDVTTQVASRKRIEQAEKETQIINEELASINEELLATNDKLIELSKKCQESEERMNLAVENTDVGVFDTNLLTEKTVRTLKHAQIYGYEDNNDEWSLEDVRQHMFQEDYPAANEAYLESIKSGVLDHSFRIKRSDGVKRWIHTIGKVICNENKEPVRIIGTIKDITEKKELENQKDEFISTVSHELKTPVTSIKAYNQFLQRTLKGDVNVQNRMFLERMDGQIDRLQSLIVDLLDVTRVDQSKLLLKKEPVELNVLLTDVISELQLITPTHQLLIGHNTSILLNSDKGRLIQVITNLITNAVKYSPQAKYVNIDLKEVDGKARVSIQDFGVGIPKAYHSLIFERFHQLDQEHPESGLNLGLGLYISKEIITKAGGELWCESEFGKGSTFYFNLPL